MNEEEYGRLHQKWQDLFNYSLNNPSKNKKINKDFVVDDKMKQYFFDEKRLRGLITDELTPEELDIVFENFRKVVFNRNADKNRVNELSDLVLNSNIKNLKILRKYEGKFNLSTS